MTNTENVPDKTNPQAKPVTRTDTQPPVTDAASNTQAGETPQVDTAVQQEHGGPKGLEPTRYGDWERNGRCTDF